MDDKTRALVALGSSAAVNCRPCLEHHLAAARGLGLEDGAIAEAVEVGLTVNQGAARQTRQFTDGLLATAGVAAGPAGKSCC